MTEDRGLRTFRALLRRWAREDTAPDTVAEPAPPAESADQGVEWAEFIKKELEREYSRRDAVNTRAAGSVTSATALITVTLAVVGIAKGAHYVISGLELLALLAAALLLLLVAAVLSIVAGAVGGDFEVASENDMRRMLSPPAVAGEHHRCAVLHGRPEHHRDHDAACGERQEIPLPRSRVCRAGRGRLPAGAVRAEGDLRLTAERLGPCVHPGPLRRRRTPWVAQRGRMNNARWNCGWPSL